MTPRDRTDLADVAPDNARLRRAIRDRLVSNTPEANLAFWDALLHSRLMLALEDKPGQKPIPGWTSFDPKRDTVGFHTLPLDKGGLHVLTFTDPDAMRCWRPGAGNFITFPVPGLFELVLSTPDLGGIIINVKRDDLVLGRVTIKQVADLTFVRSGRRRSIIDLAPGTCYCIKRPEKPPAKSVAVKLAEIARGEPAIEHVYLFRMSADESPLLLTIGLELKIALDREQQDVLVDRLMSRLQRTLPKNQEFQVMVLDLEDLLAAVRRLVRPLESSG